MATVNLSAFDISKLPSAKGMKFAIVCSQWNDTVTGALLNGAIDTLKGNGVGENDIFVDVVPGTFELTFGAKYAAKQYNPDAIIVLGCVVRGGTPHFDYVCSGVTQGITTLNVELDIPVIFGVLTTDNQQQAEDRAGGKLGNKGDEAAYTAIMMAGLNKK